MESGQAVEDDNLEFKNVASFYHPPRHTNECLSFHIRGPLVDIE